MGRVVLVSFFSETCQSFFFRFCFSKRQCHARDQKVSGTGPIERRSGGILLSSWLPKSPIKIKNHRLCVFVLSFQEYIYI